jgi:hypothetical protein
MKYSNPRKKLVNNLRGIAIDTEYAGLVVVTKNILSICHDLLKKSDRDINVLTKVKKVKKEKCNCETEYEFSSCPIHSPISPLNLAKIEPLEEPESYVSNDWRIIRVEKKVDELVERINSL